MPTMIVEQLRSSVGALSAERRRLEDEVIKLEKKVMATDTDDLIRRLKSEIDAVDAEQAKKRDLLARAEQQTKTLERDRAAAQAAAHREAEAACRARLGALLDRELALLGHIERLAREMLDARRELIANHAEVRAEAGRLGRADLVPSEAEMLGRQSLREAKLLSQLPSCRHRFGYITLPSGSFGLSPPDLSWPEDEARFCRDVRALVEEAN